MLHSIEAEVGDVNLERVQHQNNVHALNVATINKVMMAVIKVVH